MYNHRKHSIIPKMHSRWQQRTVSALCCNTLQRHANHVVVVHRNLSRCHYLQDINTFIIGKKKKRI